MAWNILHPLNSVNDFKFDIVLLWLPFDVFNDFVTNKNLFKQQ